LDAQMVTQALDDDAFAALELLTIENVGNLICPAEYDLGEDLRVVLFSVTEGEDKPLKYPLAFTTAHAAVVSKIDLATATEFDREAAIKNIHVVHPDLPVLELSVKTGEGVDRWIEFLETRIAQKRVLVS
jgi:hydrogenase nickel incorporation protein HypB